MSSEPAPSTFDDDDLFTRARAGDESAWKELFQKCYPKVVRVVRRKLNTPMRSLFDSTDFASDVMKSLAANAGRLDFDSFQSLMAFLARVAEQKVVDEYRKAHTLKRDLDRTLSLYPDARDGDGSLAVASLDPTASQLALADEAQERLLAGQSEPGRAVIEMKQQGYTCIEIAEQTGWNIRKVQRFFKGLQETYLKAGQAG